MRTEYSDRAIEEQPFTATAVNGIATATAPVRGNMRFHLTAIRFSANGAPAAVVQVEVRTGGTSWIRYEVPAAAFAPINIERRRPLAFPRGVAVNAVLPALGAAIRGTIEIEGFYGD